MRSITRIITQRLKLKVNEVKSAVARPQERKLLGFSFTSDPEIRRAIAPKALARFKDKIREITRHAAGTYVTSSKGLEGLAAWTQADRPIENTDIVAWYTLRFHHMVRLEDWPIMPILRHDFLIRPQNFFEKNPVLTLPHEQ
jgi:hypothetical protein